MQIFKRIFLVPSSSNSMKLQRRRTLVQGEFYSTQQSVFNVSLKPLSPRFLSGTLSLIMLSLTFASCTKVIDVQLNEADKKYVIEGTVSNNSLQPVHVKLSQTKSFEASNDFNGISGALVTIQVNNDSTYTLTEITAGIYQTSAFTGVPGKTYKLTVKVKDEVFTSTCVLPAQVVTLDTLTVEDITFGGDALKTIYPAYQDPLGLGNSYRFIEYVNGKQVKTIFAQNDDFSDGLVTTRPFIDPDGDIKSGDVVKVIMQCIDKAVYKYWFSLSESATGDNQSATPTNPASNISGGALGYFSAHSVNDYSIVVP